MCAVSAVNVGMLERIHPWMWPIFSNVKQCTTQNTNWNDDKTPSISTAVSTLSIYISLHTLYYLQHVHLLAKLISTLSKYFIKGKAPMGKASFCDMKLQRVGGQWAYFYNQNKVMPNEHWPFSFYPIFKRMEQKTLLPWTILRQSQLFLIRLMYTMTLLKILYRSIWWFTRRLWARESWCSVVYHCVWRTVAVDREQISGQWRTHICTLHTNTYTCPARGHYLQYSRCRVVAILSCLRIQAFSTIFCWYFDCF